MISKAVGSSVAAAVDYFEEHLNVADYFVEGEKVDRGQFVGRVAERVGLNEAPVTRERFLAFAECDMEALGADSGRPRTSEIKYIEFTYSAPKAVSIVAALDGRVKNELHGAVKEELNWFETLVDVRDRRGPLASEEVTKSTSEMLAALFRHETSRTNDPDFHVHSLIGNVTWDAERKGYFAVHYGRMLELRKTLDARIHNNLAARMAKLGYHVEVARFGFGLKEVPRLAVELFSERAIQIERVKELFKRGYSPAQLAQALKGTSDAERKQLLARPGLLAEKMGRPEGPSRVTIDHILDQQAATLTRPKKVRITSQTLREDVGKRLNEAGLIIEKPSLTSVRVELGIKEAIEQGAHFAFEKQSVVALEKLHGEIIRLAPGAISNEELMTQLRNDRHFLIREVEGRELVTTRAILSEEKTLLTTVVRGMRSVAPLQMDYVPPATLIPSPERINEILAQAQARGEQLTRAQAEQWLSQFGAIHHYVCTSTDRYLNIRGGAGTGKTFSLELLVRESLAAGRPVFLCAPYGEQARMALRNEAARLEAAGQLEVARVFTEANTVDYLIARARNNPQLLQGADIYVDEAGLLDTPKALALADETERAGARVIFQGDTEQMAAVGRGQPIQLLQEELGLGMDVPRASISRRQLSAEDKKLAADLSSGDDGKFAHAVQCMLDRGMIRESAPDEAIELVAREIVEARGKGEEIVAVSSVHRISDALAERIHALHVEKSGSGGQAFLDVHVKQELQPAELRSSQFYRAGDVVEFKDKGSGSMLRAPVLSIQADAVTIERKSESVSLSLTEVRAVFDASRIERGPGETLLLQEKIKQDGKIFEKGSRQIIAEINHGAVRFESGLKLAADDGRVRQGDCLTDYKAQGLKGMEVRGIEDNGSASSMANKEAFHVKGTRHVEKVVLHVENKSLYTELIQRSNEKFSALQLERQPISPQPKVEPSITPAPAINKAALYMQVRDWGKEFLNRFNPQQVVEQMRAQWERFEVARARMVETPASKIEPAVREIVVEKVAVEIPVEKLSLAEAPAPLVKPAVTEKPRIDFEKIIERAAELPKPEINLTPAMAEVVYKAIAECIDAYRASVEAQQKQAETQKPKVAPELDRPKHSNTFNIDPPSQQQGARISL